MMNLFKEIRTLRKEGKLHTALLNRTRILFGISTILLLVILFNIFFREVNSTIILGIISLSSIGFFLGLHVFSKMNAVNWNEEEGMVKTSKMGTLGYMTLGLYIIFEVGLRTFLNSNFPLYALPLLLAGIFGTLFGRVIGTLLEIHRVYLFNHSK